MCGIKSSPGSPVQLSSPDGCWECPPAFEERTLEVLTPYDQCLFLPGEVVQVMRHCQYQTLIMLKLPSIVTASDDGQ